MKKNILLVEDHTETASLIRITLQEEGYDVVHSKNGETAVELCGQIKFDLVLMDINLGLGIDGVEAAKQILSHHELPLVFMSSYSEKIFIDKTKAINSYGYISKNSCETVILAQVAMAFRLFETQKSLKAKDHLMSLTSQMANVGGWEFDALSMKGTWTDEVARIHDLEPDSDTNFEVGISFFLPQYRDMMSQAIRDAVELARPYDLEVELLSFKGVHKWIRTAGIPMVEEGKVLKVQGIFQDITRIKTNEQALRNSEKLFSSYINSSPLGIFVVNSRGEYQFVNQSACQLTGFSEGELLQMNLGQLAAPSNFENSLNSFRILQETGRVKQEIVLRKKEGVDINMMLEATKIDDENYIGFCSDLSEIKKSQKELQKINANLRIFNDVLAHDLKEPARTIRQLMELLLRKYAPELDHGMQELIQMAKEVADKNEQMIAGMYQFLVLGNKNIVKSKISMGEIIEHALKLIGTLFKESGATITTGQMPMVEGEMSLLVQLLQNLLQNSIKFAQKNIKPILEFSVESVGNKMIFALKDNGRGIEKNNLPKVFGLFYRIHEENNTEGLGLGLSLCKRIVELHGGEIWVESQVNQGTTLYFSLPKVDILKKNQ